MNVGLIVPDREMAIAQFRFEKGKKVYTKEGKSYGFKIPDYNNKKITGVGLLMPIQKSQVLKQQLPKGVNLDMIKPFDNCRNM